MISVLGYSQSLIVQYQQLPRFAQDLTKEGKAISIILPNSILK